MADTGAARGLGARPLERARLQCYLALIVADIAALLAGFASAGYLYLGPAGLARAALEWQLMLPVFLTIALYNGSYSIDALLRPMRGALKAMAAAALASAAVANAAWVPLSNLLLAINAHAA